MKKVIPNLSVENCEAALDFYQEIFGGEMKNLQKTDGVEMFKGQEGKILHAELHVNDACIFYLNDIFDQGEAGDRISIVLELESQKEIEQIYHALKEKGQVTFELQKTFWGSYHAVVTDCYGIKWSLDYAA